MREKIRASRRKVLKNLGASGSVLTFGTLPVTANSGSKRGGNGLDEKHQLPHDLGVINNSADTKELLVEILSKDDSDTIYQRRFRLRGYRKPGNNDKSESRYFGDVSVRGSGVHKLRVTTDSGETAEKRIHVYENGIPIFAVVSIYIHVHGGLGVNYGYA